MCVDHFVYVYLFIHVHKYDIFVCLRGEERKRTISRSFGLFEIDFASLFRKRDHNVTKATVFLSCNWLFSLLDCHRVIDPYPCISERFLYTLTQLFLLTWKCFKVAAPPWI